MYAASSFLNRRVFSITSLERVGIYVIPSVICQEIKKGKLPNQSHLQNLCPRLLITESSPISESQKKKYHRCCVFKQILIISWEICPVKTKLQARKLKFVIQINGINDQCSNIVHEGVNTEEVLKILLLGKETGLKKKKSIGPWLLINVLQYNYAILLPKCLNWFRYLRLEFCGCSDLPMPITEKKYKLLEQKRNQCGSCQIKECFCLIPSI